MRVGLVKNEITLSDKLIIKNFISLVRVKLRTVLQKVSAIIAYLFAPLFVNIEEIKYLVLPFFRWQRHEFLIGNFSQQSGGKPFVVGYVRMFFKR